VKSFRNARNIINTSAKNAFNKIQLTTSVKLLHVLLPRCHLQRDFRTNELIHPQNVLSLHSFFLRKSLMMAPWHWNMQNLSRIVFYY